MTLRLTRLSATLAVLLLVSAAGAGAQEPTPRAIVFEQKGALSSDYGSGLSGSGAARSSCWACLKGRTAHNPFNVSRVLLAGSVPRIR
jgi:hypothetical protein